MMNLRRSHVITRDLFLFACYTGTAYADDFEIARSGLQQLRKHISVQFARL